MKNIKQILIIVGLLFVMTGCPISSGTGVVPMGPDTYMIARQGSSGGTLVAEALREANEYCLSNRKKMMPVTTNTHPSTWRAYEAEIQFMCLSDDDYELKRPKMRPILPEQKSTIDLNIQQK